MGGAWKQEGLLFILFGNAADNFFLGAGLFRGATYPPTDVNCCYLAC